MAENKIALKIVTPTREMYNGEADMVIMRSTSGDVGILPGHQPLVTVLDYGVLRIKNDGKEEKAALLGGFAEVSPTSISILTDAAEWSTEIDVLRAKQAKERAERRLRSQTGDLDVLRAEFALKRALTRIDAAGEEE
jgi:F-type H+-transporting ATPase subunit epsilon